MTDTMQGTTGGAPATVTMNPPTIGNVFDIDTARTRRTDPRQSHEAADTNDVEASIGLVLETLRKLGPMHDERLVMHIQSAAVFDTGIPKFTEQRIRTARSALVDRGLVIATTISGVKTTRGRSTTVWAAV